MVRGAFPAATREQLHAEAYPSVKFTTKVKLEPMGVDDRQSQTSQGPSCMGYMLLR